MKPTAVLCCTLLLPLLLWLCGPATAIFFVPSEPQTNQAGQCPSGIPRDGLFSNCALERWRIGSFGFDQDILPSPSTVSFGPDFTHHPSGIDLDLNANTNSSGCSMRITGTGVVFQPLSNLRYAHYRVHGCARSLGDSRCKIVVKDSFNRIVDSMEVRGRACDSPPPAACVDCADGITNMTIRYLGTRPTDIIVRLVGDSDNSHWHQIMNVIQGDEFELSPLDFPLNFESVLPETLEFITTAYNGLADVFSFNCSSFTALPGQTFGDRNQFLVASAFSDHQQFCSVNPVSLPTCQCFSDHNDESCVQSDRGFVAQPNQLYYLALVSEECGCEFDNVCFEQVGGPLGYFGVDWAVGANLTTADFQ